MPFNDEVTLRCRIRPDLGTDKTAPHHNTTIERLHVHYRRFTHLFAEAGLLNFTLLHCTEAEWFDFYRASALLC